MSIFDMTRRATLGGTGATALSDRIEQDREQAELAAAEEEALAQEEAAHESAALQPSVDVSSATVGASGLSTSEEQRKPSSDADLSLEELIKREEEKYLKRAARRDPRNMRGNRKHATIQKMPDKVLLVIFSFLPKKEVLKCAQVCQSWRTLTQNPELWRSLCLRANYDGGLQVTNVDYIVQLINTRFIQLRAIELATDLITPTVLYELANRCPKLHYMTLDFSTAMQLHDFSDLQAFPSRLGYLALCLSENIFLEGFLRKIYAFISSVETLHVIGTYENVQDEEEEVYETVNLQKLKQYLPNLRVVNLWGVVFVTDEHVESLSSNCAHLECLCINYCQKVTGACLKLVVQRCKKLKSLFLAHTSLDNKTVQSVEWEKTNLHELDISATELSSESLSHILCRLPNLRWFKGAFLEFFTDQVLQAWMESGAVSRLQYLDLDTSDNLSEAVLADFLSTHANQIIAINLGGHHKLVENFWMNIFRKMNNVRTIVMGIAEDCCPKVQAKIHIDQFIDCLATNCPKLRRIEIRWDDETLRFSDKSSKFIDVMRMRCLKLHSVTLSDGRYYELVRSNFERADRVSVVRTTEMNRTGLMEFSAYYRQLLFN